MFSSILITLFCWKSVTWIPHFGNFLALTSFISSNGLNGLELFFTSVNTHNSSAYHRDITYIIYFTAWSLSICINTTNSWKCETRNFSIGKSIEWARKVSFRADCHDGKWTKTKCSRSRSWTSSVWESNWRIVKPVSTQEILFYFLLLNLFLILFLCNCIYILGHHYFIINLSMN